MIEYTVLDSDWELLQYFNKGWEIVKVYYVDGVQHETVSEEVPTFSVSTGIPVQPNQGYGYQQPQKQYLSKSVPVVVKRTKFILKRTPAAKTLYEKSLHENKPTNT